jgi:hypothetical protein
MGVLMPVVGNKTSGAEQAERIRSGLDDTEPRLPPWSRGN